MRILILVVALVSGGCFTYAPLPADAPEPPPGTRVRAELTESGQERLLPLTGRMRPWAQGTFVSAAQDSLVLAVEYRGFSSTQEGASLQRNVTIPRAEVEEIRLRELSVARTGLLAAAGAVAVYLLLSQISGTQGGDIPDPPPPVL